MRIMGIDPGTATTGFSIIDSIKGKISLLDYGCIRTHSSLPQCERLKQISEDLTVLIEKWEPYMASVEKLFFQKNIKTAMTVAEARGIILGKLAETNIEIGEYTPLEIKSAICGYGKADKKMVQQMIKAILGLQRIPKPDDAADAIAAAICMANSHNLKQRIQK